MNIEKLRRDEDEKSFSGTLEFDLSARSGNVETLELGIGGRVDYVREATTTFLVGSGGLGWEGGERYSNQALVHLRQVYRRRSRLQPEAFVQFDYNKSRKLAFRGLVGGGLRIGLYRNRGVQFWWGSAYMLEHERLDLASGDVHPRRTSVHRWSNYLSSNVGFNEQTTLSLTFYAQPQFDDPADVRILSEADLGVELRRPVFLVMTVRMRYDSRPPVDTKSLDTTLTSGVAIEF